MPLTIERPLLYLVKVINDGKSMLITIMKYLINKSKLTPAEINIKASEELSKRRAANSAYDKWLFGGTRMSMARRKSKIILKSRPMA